MNTNRVNFVLLIMLILIAIFGYLNLSTKKELEQKRESFIAFQKSAKEIYLLKKLRKNQKAVLSSLTSIKQPKVIDKSSSKVYTFENLNVNRLNRLIKRVQGSFLDIKKLEIKNDTTNHAALILEITK